jgi:hypothetical protein
MGLLMQALEQRRTRGRPEYWTKWRVMRELESMYEQVLAETDPKTMTLTFKGLLLKRGLHTMIFQVWGEKFGTDPEISLSVFALKEIFEQRLVESGLRGHTEAWLTQFILKNNYGYSDDPAHSAREDDRLELEHQQHAMRLSDARKRGELEGPRSEE